jgi:hypothetical protein
MARSPAAAINAGTTWTRVSPMIPHTGKFFGALEFDGECVSILAGRAAHDAPAKLVASVTRGIDPGPIIGHRAFDAKEA